MDVKVEDIADYIMNTMMKDPDQTSSPRSDN
jgi:hypothetical protein